MSTISIAQAPATRLRITARGRRVLTALAAAPLVAAIGIGALSGGAALASRDAGAPAGTFDTVTVMAGDTLWGIAEEVAPGADPRDVVDEIARLNQLSGSGVVAGQQLAIPAEYSAGE
ncbi:LysM peptidoglycan-binding domain-containing protein [Microbacterium betulae]|uniref:LysM peptidoglycan-binding domain-containing protein n=1 Tax=Microbacterium betulae TaxID=2981139 RepID=A0AA97FG27_9MICO|nr:LysM peptidoglycan-binding domain-containing protein [Microbacterium sp. AB]WOF22008.1 LysM peptidoglycan-binding domain-containing protein [Microbacterium sp. AB]